MKRILIMAGGTGGHVFPGIAVAKVLKQKGHEVAWLGTVGGMEKQWVQAQEIPFYQVSIKGLRGNGLLGWLKSPLNVFRAWRQARSVIQQVQPNLVLGMGGFVCGPGGLAAKTMGIDLVLHEQNAIVGLTNRLLAPFAKWVITAFPQHQLTGKKVVFLGNPVREGLAEISVVSHQTVESLLVVGGSRGALALNQIVPEALKLLPEDSRPNVVHQTGEKTLSKAREFYKNAGIEADVVPFIDDMVNAYAQADLVICRSGALTVSELMTAARPAIMVPFPFAVDDHQTANAQVLVEMQGGEVIQQSQLTPELLAQKIIQWQQVMRCANASKHIRGLAPVDVTEKIVILLLKSV